MMMPFFVLTHHVLSYADILKFLHLVALNRVPRHNRRTITIRRGVYNNRSLASKGEFCVLLQLICTPGVYTRLISLYFYKLAVFYKTAGDFLIYVNGGLKD
jgi:hypothetical protein